MEEKLSMGEFMRRIIDMKSVTVENSFEDEAGNLELSPGEYQVDELIVKSGINGWHIVVEYHQLKDHPLSEDVAFSSPEEFAQVFGITELG